MDAFQRGLDREAIAEELKQMEAGRGKPINAAFEEMQEKLDLPSGQ